MDFFVRATTTSAFECEPMARTISSRFRPPIAFPLISMILSPRCNPSPSSTQSTQKPGCSLRVLAFQRPVEARTASSVRFAPDCSSPYNTLEVALFMVGPVAVERCCADTSGSKR
uniref:Uncharacterized protein n=1 Tax=Anopheles atroparvus TaxID=41427 RepID=A0A182J892_ANOAO